MESENLRTASLYINNQLLSRGLLRNGQTIEFAHPEKGDGGVDGTMGRIMSVINDLILRRDRDAQQRESLSTTLRTLRADSLRQTTDLERINTKNAEAQRKLGIAEASERALKQQIRSAEHAARGLKEEMARMKVLVNQTRSGCANEVRKRERVIEGLKRHVGEGGRARGGGKAPGVIKVDVVAGIGGEANPGDVVGVEDSAYDLRSETNEFLTELARGLSEENENVVALLRRTVETLRVLSGCDREGVQQEGQLVIETENGYENLAAEIELVIEHLRTLLTNPSFVPLEEVEVREEEIIRLREGWERMEARWREAVQMMDGWRKRMARSGQTVNLEELKMGLMLSPLKPKEEELGHGFQLSTLMEEGEGDTQADINAMDDSGIPDPEPEFDDESGGSDSSMSDDELLDEASQEVEEEQRQQQDEDETFNTESSISPGSAPQLSPLRETSGNRLAYPNGPQKEEFSTIVEENTYELLQLESSPQKPAKSARSTPQPPASQRIQKNENSHLSVALDDEISLLKTSATSQRSITQSRSRSSSPQKSSHPAVNPSPIPIPTPSSSSRHSIQSNPTPTPSSRPAKEAKQTNPIPHDLIRPAEPKSLSGPKIPTTPRLRTDASSRLPRPRENQLPQQSPLTMATIAAKLAATEREADAARVRAKLKAARMNRAASNPTNPLNQSSTSNPSNLDTEATKLMPPPPKRDASGEFEPSKQELLEADENDEKPATRKRKAVGRTQGGRASRRRSTLSPWELESLILVGLGEGSPAKGDA